MDPQMTVNMTSQGVLSPEGQCKTFDESVDGFARAEAIVAIHIKKLSDAVQDNDPIRAVIMSSCANSDGKTAGMGQPNAERHAVLMKQCHALAGLSDYSQTAMIECHGTGTAVSW